MKEQSTKPGFYELQSLPNEKFKSWIIQISEKGMNKKYNIKKILKPRDALKFLGSLPD